MLRHSISKPSRRSGLRLAGIAASVGLLATVSGCGLLGGDDGEETGGGGGGLETSTITVSHVPAIEAALLHLAEQEGYFKEEGLTVNIEQAKSGQDALTKMIGGDSQFALSSYVPFFAAQEKGAADIKLVTDSASAAPNTMMLVTARNSNVKTVRDLEGKRVAVSALNTISDAMVKSVMQTNGLDYNTVEFVPVSFPDQEGALSRGDVDVAQMIEPFLTQSASAIGSTPVIDIATGPAEDMPLSGYGALAEFVEKNPKTVAAFHRAMQKATQDAEDRSKLEPILVEQNKLDPATAKLVTLPTLRADIDPARLQRVPDLMLEFDILKEKIDVSSMLANPAQNES